MRYLYNLLVALDQLANTIAGGNPDSTISGRVGYHVHTPPASRYWQVLRAVIDWIFFPIDGPGHCYQARLNDDEVYVQGSWLHKIILAAGVGVACLPLAVLVRLIAWGKSLSTSQ